MLLPKSSCVRIPRIKSVAPWVCLVKVPFFLPFFGPDMKTDVGVITMIHVLKTFPRLY